MSMTHHSSFLKLSNHNEHRTRDQHIQTAQQGRTIHQHHPQQCQEQPILSPLPPPPSSLTTTRINRPTTAQARVETGMPAQQPVTSQEPRARSMPDKIPITVFAEEDDYDWFYPHRPTSTIESSSAPPPALWPSTSTRHLQMREENGNGADHVDRNPLATIPFSIIPSAADVTTAGFVTEGGRGLHDHHHLQQQQSSLQNHATISSSSDMIPTIPRRNLYPEATLGQRQQSLPQHHALEDDHHHKVSFSSSSSSSNDDRGESSSYGDTSSSSYTSTTMKNEDISPIYDDVPPDEFSFNLAHLSLQQSYATHKPERQQPQQKQRRQHTHGRSSGSSTAQTSRSTKRIKHEENPVVCAMHHHQKYLHDKKRRRDDRKMERDAAMAAAMYYGECYIEGVGMSDADKAARDSHEWYKKWWLQEVHAGDKIMASLGDAFRVPRYNSPPSKAIAIPHSAPADIAGMKKAFSGETNNDSISNRDSTLETTCQDETMTSFGGAVANGQQTNFIAATTLPSPMVASHEVHIDRASGARNPPVSSNALSGPSSDFSTNYATSRTNMGNLGTRRARNTTRNLKSPSFSSACERDSACSSTDETVPFSNRHEPRGLDSTFLDIPSSTSATLGVPTENQEEAYNSMANFDATTQISLQSEPQQTAFECTRNERKERERRFSSYSDYDDNPYYKTSQSGNITANHEPIGAGQASREVNQLQMLALHCNDEEKYNAILTSISAPLERTAKHIDNAKMDLIQSLSISGGDVTTPSFLFALEQLRTLYVMTDHDARYRSTLADRSLEGNWLTISRPHYAESLGTNTNGEYMYSLGRMSFDMFAPGNLICSIHGIFNSIDIVHDRNCAFKSVPKSLKAEVEDGNTVLRTYNIITSFHVEPDSPLFGSQSPNRNVQKALRGTITTFGYVLPDPKTANRLSIWFSGGKIEPHIEQDDDDMDKWKKAFGGGTLKRQLQEKARVLAAKLLLGAVVPTQMENDGSMEFTLTRPIGGHGSAYVDVLYLDDNLRIVQGHRGSIFVMTRVTS